MIVIAGHDDDGLAGESSENARRLFDVLHHRPRRIKEVACDHEKICLPLVRGLDEPPEGCEPLLDQFVADVGGVLLEGQTHVDVGRVKNANGHGI